MSVLIEVNGKRVPNLSYAEIKSAAKFFAEKSSSRVKTPFRHISIILQDDEESAQAHLAINRASGATDVITQRYDEMPGEDSGVYGELYVNVKQAKRASLKYKNWSEKKELFLYIAHGMDHLSGANDLTEKEYRQMRRRELSWIRAYLKSGKS